ncbi:reverse transcriptase domain-containing protein, partial [Actinobacillus pleuropneumoniae]
MTPDRFRPIALCNVVYKIISKIIANRLKPLLPTLMSEEKTGYVEGRQILNNIIQAHEVVHSLISKRK